MNTWWYTRLLVIAWLTGGSAGATWLAWYAAQGVPVVTPV